MNYWIFQGNPDIFDVTEYVARNNEILWSVRQAHLAQHMKPGDEVFIWRAAGKIKAISGVVAIAHITGDPHVMPDDLASLPYWRKGDPNREELRVELKIEKRCLGSKEIIKKEWITVDPELKSLRILRMQNETNYRITAAEAKRLSMLCQSAGSDWSREEDVAALWAFKETEGTIVSKTIGSPVAMVASIVGRPIGGIYNKVMNFRHIDPRDSRVGLPNINHLDREVWAEFYDEGTKQINAKALDTEFNRLWEIRRQPERHSQKYKDFGEAPDDNPNELAKFAAKVRKGQPKFRKKLMELYENKCALSGWGPPEVLEAAHIYAHAKSGINHSKNGLLIRADLHYLMDAGLLRIHPTTLKIQLNEKLRDTAYWELNGQQLRSCRDGSHPSAEYLKRRFAEDDEP